MKRPLPPRPAPEGHEWAAVPDKDWRLVTSKNCRRQAAGHQVCAKDAVAEFKRLHAGFGPTQYRWWAYCAEHMYGRWVEDGQVMCWVLRGGEQ